MITQQISQDPIGLQTSRHCAIRIGKVSKRNIDRTGYVTLDKLVGGAHVDNTQGSSTFIACVAGQQLLQFVHRNY